MSLLHVMCSAPTALAGLAIFKEIYLQKVVCYQSCDKHKLITGKSHFIVGTPIMLLVWFIQCCNLPAGSACLVIRLSKRRLQYIT